jgi:aryl-alcohol dehydrogenase-like predicted oxidoreductase
MKIAIGAAQFGMNYGISNINGKTTQFEVSRILKYAEKNEINYIDTASKYGDSEQTIGSIVEQNKYNIITKTPTFHDENIIRNIHLNELKKSFKQSLNLLKQNHIYGLLAHSCDDLLKPGGDILFEEMERLKLLGIVNKIGVSVYSSYQIEAILDKYTIDLIQLPLNIVDQKILYDGSLLRLKEKGVEIHVRSVFLQGLLLMPLSKLPIYFSAIKPTLKKFHSYANSLSLTSLELAIAFVNNINQVDQVVVGFNSLEQLKEVFLASDVVLDPLDFSDLSINDTNFTNPSMWKT